MPTSDETSGDEPISAALEETLGLAGEGAPDHVAGELIPVARPSALGLSETVPVALEAARVAVAAAGIPSRELAASLEKAFELIDELAEHLRFARPPSQFKKAVRDNTPVWLGQAKLLVARARAMTQS